MARWLFIDRVMTEISILLEIYFNLMQTFGIVNADFTR